MGTTIGNCVGDALTAQNPESVFDFGISEFWAYWMLLLTPHVGPKTVRLMAQKSANGLSSLLTSR